MCNVQGDDAKVGPTKSALREEVETLKEKRASKALATLTSVRTAT